MRNVFTGTLVALGALTLAVPAAAQFGGPPPPPNTGVPVYAELSGGDGSGNITIVVDPPKGTACYIMNVQRVEGATAARVQVGGPSENGRVVLNLEAPQNGTAGGCVNVSADVANALISNPGGHSVVIQTREHGNVGGMLKA